MRNIASITGGFKTNTVLRKPFEAVLAATGIGKHLTAKAMRRTLNDLTRLAGVRDVVIRAISGHQTETMQQHYSTAGKKERLAAVASVVDIASRRPKATRVPARDTTEPVAGARRNVASAG